MSVVLGPTLTTLRLTLRPPRESDFDALIAFHASARMRFLGGPIDKTATWRTLLADIGHWTLRGYGLFSIELTESGTFVGRASVINHYYNEEPELAWHLFEGFDGHGYATEAAIAARDWYYATTGNGPLMSWCNIENYPSQAVAKRLGATFERLDTTASGHQGQIWRHQK